MRRDIKLANIVYESADLAAEVKLIDFGLATKVAGLDEMNEQMGTPFYMAPECACCVASRHMHAHYAASRALCIDCTHMYDTQAVGRRR